MQGRIKADNGVSIGPLSLVPVSAYTAMEVKAMCSVNWSLSYGVDHLAEKNDGEPVSL